MKKNYIAALAAFMMAAVCMTGCGESIPDAEDGTKETPVLSLDDTDGKDEVLTMDDGSTVIATDDGSFISEEDGGLVWNYLAGTCTVKFPIEWKDRFVVRGTSVYSKKCFEKQENSGELFTIVFSRDINMLQGPKPAVVFGVIHDMYAVITTPENPNYDASDAEIATEYADLSAKLSDVFQNAVCGDTPNFKPINLTNYVPAAESAASVLPGTWKLASLTDDAAFSPYVVFRASDSTFGYKYGENDLKLGAYYANKNAETYEWNTDNWGDAGLIFSEGKVYRVTYYETAPRTLDFEVVYSPDAETDSLIGNKFNYDSEEQGIRQTEADPTEAALS